MQMSQCHNVTMHVPQVIIFYELGYNRGVPCVPRIPNGILKVS